MEHIDSESFEFTLLLDRQGCAQGECVSGLVDTGLLCDLEKKLSLRSQVLGVGFRCICNIKRCHFPARSQFLWIPCLFVLQ